MRLRTYDEIDSTNAEALRLLRQGEPGPLWITADRQSAGRGRRGRKWISVPGNLHASLLLTDPGPVEDWPQLAFVAALAVHDAVVEVAPAIRPMLELKWPNDVLLSGAKFAGILIEGEGREEEGAVVIGIGINCAAHPAGAAFPATDLTAVGARKLVGGGGAACWLSRSRCRGGSRNGTAATASPRSAPTGFRRAAAGLGEKHPGLVLPDRELFSPAASKKGSTSMAGLPDARSSPTAARSWSRRVTSSAS